jgi:hypothetical protein
MEIYVPEAKEDFKAMVLMVAMAMEAVEEMVNTLLIRRLLQKLQSRDSRRTKPMRDPRRGPG